MKGASTNVAIETKRMWLLPCLEEDAGFIYELLNSPGWLQHIGDRNIRNLEDAKSYIQTMQKQAEESGLMGMLKMQEKSTKLNLGLCGLIRRPFLPVPDIGFAILPQYERQGLTLEAAKGVLTHAHDHMGISTLMGFTSPQNVASQQLLIKLGMKLREKKWIDQYNEDCLVFSE